MTTSTLALQHLDTARTSATAARDAINGLIVEHDYQDVAALITESAIALLNAAALLMRNDDENGFAALESADDLLDRVYGIIDSEIDDDEGE